MKKIVFGLFLLAMSSGIASQGKINQKTIDDGGSGAYMAEAREEKTFGNAVIYKPVDMKAAVAKEGRLPVLVWANGGCNDTSLPHERMLNEVASRGYIVIALGGMQERIDDRQLNKSPNEQMLQAMDWIAKENDRKRSDYYGMADVEKIAVAGQSCGGAQALVVSADSRVKTTVMVNSGMGDIEMSGASRASLQALHAPILYMPGGEGDIAYRNAVLDYQRINHVPAAFANHLTAGHGGDYELPFGGSFARMLTAWLDSRVVPIVGTSSSVIIWMSSPNGPCNPRILYMVRSISLSR